MPTMGRPNKTQQSLRVLSLVPSLTEAVILLGGQAMLMGKTRFCTHPPFAIKKVPSVGGTKNPDIETIQRLKPDVVLASKEENKKEDIERLVGLGFWVWMSCAESPSQAFDELREIKELLGLMDPKFFLSRSILEYERLSMASLQTKPLPTLCLIWKRPFMAVGQDTYAGRLLEDAGLRSPLKGRYPKLTEGDILALEPKLILLPDEPYPFSQSDAEELAMAFERAGKPNPHLRLLKGRNLFWPGLRAPLGLRDLLKRTP